MERKRELEKRLVEVMKSLSRCTQPEKSSLLISKREILNELAAIKCEEE